MPFFLYKTTGKPSRMEYTLVRQVSLGGNGPVKQYVISQNPTETVPFNGTLLRIN